LESLRSGGFGETSPLEATTVLCSAGPLQASALGRWAWAAAAGLIVLISLAPLLIVDVPAVLDYPNHLARFFILAHPQDPILGKMYAPHWAVLPNLGMDVLGRMLLSIVPPHVGGRILLGLSLLAPLAGAVVYARAAFGRWTWWSLGAGTIAFNGIFILGFMNFLLALGVALAGAAAWRVWRQGDRRTVAALGGAVISLTAFFCHLLGFAYFAVLIAADEAEALLRLRKAGQLTWRHALSSAGLLAAALGPTLAVYVVSRRPTSGGDWIAWCWGAKSLQWLMPFMGYDRWATVATAIILCSLIVLVWRRSQRAGGAALALAVLGGGYLAAPLRRRRRHLRRQSVAADGRPAAVRRPGAAPVAAGGSGRRPRLRPGDRRPFSSRRDELARARARPGRSSREPGLRRARFEDIAGPDRLARQSAPARRSYPAERCAPGRTPGLDRGHRAPRLLAPVVRGPQPAASQG
jgi:hypothetical protein